MRGTMSADSLIVCMVEFEVKDDGEAVAAFGGDRFAIVLEFEFLSRIIASMQSMSFCRHDWRRLIRV
jgi:hypothetical protein